MNDQFIIKKKEKRKGKWTTRQWKETEREKKRNLNTVEHSIKKKKKRKKLNIWNFDCRHIVILFWLVQNSWKIRRKATLELFFSVSYYEIWRKPLTGDLILGYEDFKIMLILNFFRILGFRGIGNIFFRFLFLSESWTDSRLGQRFMEVVLQIVLGIR